MTLQSITHSIQSVGFLTDIRESALVYPVIMATHLTCIAVFGGLILMTDLRLLGVVMKNYPVADVIRQLRPWKWLGFIIMVAMGLLLGTSEAEKYSGNPYFWIKMSLLFLVAVHALVFWNVYHNPEEIDRAPVIPGRAKAAGLLSLVLWMGIVCAGRWIGYYEPKDKNNTRQAVVIP